MVLKYGIGGMAYQIAEQGTNGKRTLLLLGMLFDIINEEHNGFY